MPALRVRHIGLVMAVFFGVACSHPHTPSPSPGTSTTTTTSPAPPVTGTAATAPTPGPVDDTNAAASLPSARALLDRAIESMGGRAALDRVRTAYLEGSLVLKMIPTPIEHRMWWDRSGKAHVERQTRTLVMTRAANGPVGWSTNSFASRHKTLLEREAQTIFADIHPGLTVMLMAEEHPPVTSITRGTFDDTPCYEVQFDDPDHVTMHFNVTTGDLVALTRDELAHGHAHDDGHEHEDGHSDDEHVQRKTWRLGDWKVVDGVRVAHALRLATPANEGVLTFARIEFNGVDAERFAIPADVAVPAASE